MATVIRLTIDPVNKSCADGRARKQCRASNGIIIDPVSCSPAMLTGEILSLSQLIGALRSAASVRRQRQCHGGGALTANCRQRSRGPAGREDAMITPRQSGAMANVATRMALDADKERLANRLAMYVALGLCSELDVRDVRGSLQQPTPRGVHLPRCAPTVHPLPPPASLYHNDDA